MALPLAHHLVGDIGKPGGHVARRTGLGLAGRDGCCRVVGTARPIRPRPSSLGPCGNDRGDSAEMDRPTSATPRRSHRLRRPVGSGRSGVAITLSYAFCSPTTSSTQTTPKRSRTIP